MAAYHATILGHGVKVSYAQLWQDTTIAYSHFPDSQSVYVLRALEVTHWMFMPHFLSTTLVKRTHYALINLPVL